MSQSNSIETKFIADEGFELAAREWPVPEGTVEKAKVLFLHALNEYSGVYEQWFAQFAQAGYHVVAYDQRGHGKSVKVGKMAGVTNELFVFDDLNRVIQQLLEKWSLEAAATKNSAESTNEGYKGKFYLLGHGMGATIVLNYLTKGLYRERVDGYIAGSPWIDLGENVFSSWTLKVQVTLLAKVKPKSQFMKKFDWKKLANDDAVIDNIRKDTNLRTTYTAGQIHDCIERAQRLKNSIFVKKFVDRPLLVVHGTKDVVSPLSGVEQFYELTDLADSKLDKLDGLLHQPYFQVKDEREKYLNAVLEWLSAHSEGESQYAEFYTLKAKEAVKEAVKEPVKEPVKEVPVKEETKEETKEEIAKEETKEEVAEEETPKEVAKEEPVKETEGTKEVTEANEAKVEAPKEETKEEVKEAKAEEVKEEVKKVSKDEDIKETVEEPVAEPVAESVVEPIAEHIVEAKEDSKEEAKAEEPVEEVKTEEPVPETKTEEPTEETSRETSTEIKDTPESTPEPATVNTEAAAVGDADVPANDTGDATPKKKNNKNKNRKKKNNNKKK